MFSKADQRENQRKLRILKHADENGSVIKTCRYFGVGRSTFYRWRELLVKHSEKGLINRPSIPKQHYNRTPPEIEEKVLHLRRNYYLAPMRIVWYLERYHNIKISDATVSRILKRNGMIRLPRGTRIRTLHTKRYNKQVLGHHIQMDVKFLTFKGKQGQKVRRFQYTPLMTQHASGHSKSTKGIHNPTPSTSWIMSLRSSHSASKKFEPIMAMNSRPSSTGM